MGGEAQVFSGGSPGSGHVALPMPWERESMCIVCRTAVAQVLVKVVVAAAAVATGPVFLCTSSARLVLVPCGFRARPSK